MIYNKKDLGDFYLVSNTGEIQGVKSGKIRRKNINHEGYYFVSVSLGSRENKPTLKVHRAVAETFLQNENNYPVINHKDGDKLNNNACNLEFCTHKHNTNHAINTGLVEKKNIKIVCLNNGFVFDSITEASRWCGLANCAYSIRQNLKGKLSFAGRHPITKEKLKWSYYNNYINKIS